jgi:hypothetical protein
MARYSIAGGNARTYMKTDPEIEIQLNYSYGKAILFNGSTHPALIFI